MPRKHKETTATYIVLQYLVTLDDFATSKQIKAATGVLPSAALHELRAYKAVGVEEVKGVLYWYATPHTDTRVRTVQERVPESKPRKPKAKKL